MSRRRAATAERAAKATVSRHAALWWPAAIWVVLWVAGESAHLLLTYLYLEYLLFAAIFLTVLVCGMTCLAGYITSQRRRKTSWDVPFAATTTLITGLWVVLALAIGATTPGLIVFYLIFGPVAVIAWMMRMVMERRDADAEAAGYGVGRGNAAKTLIAAATGIQDHRAEITAANPNYIDMTVDLVESEAGQRDLQAGANKMAGAAGLAPGAVRITPMGPAENYRVRMVLQDPLTNTFPWPGPAHPGGTVFDPYPTGLYEDGELAVKYVADEAGARLEGRVGMTRSGKSNGSREEVAEHLTREDTSITVIDVKKGIQTIGPLAKGIDWLIPDLPTARRFFKRIQPALTARFNYLGARGLDAWRPGCGLRFWVLWVEEASYLDMDPDDATDVAKSCAGAGVRLIWSLQSAQHGQMPVTLRRQLTQLVIYGCNDAFDAELLPDEIAEAGGVLPMQWLANHPGRNLLVDKGLSAERMQTSIRDYLVQPDVLAAVADRWGSRPLDDITAGPLGDLYTNRQRPADMVAAIRSRMLAEPMPAAPVAAPAKVVTGVVINEHDEADEEDLAEQELASLDPLTEEDLRDMGVTTEDPAPELKVTADTPLPTIRPEDDIPIGGPEDRSPAGYVPTPEDTEAMRRWVTDVIDQHEREGQQYIAPPAFGERVGPSSPTRRSRGWFRTELLRRVDSGRLEFDETVGAFQILPDPARVTAN